MMAHLSIYTSVSHFLIISVPLAMAFNEMLPIKADRVIDKTIVDTFLEVLNKSKRITYFD